MNDTMNYTVMPDSSFLHPLLLQPAADADVPALCALMNLCYRGSENGTEAQLQGWTSEVGLVAGQRIQPDDLLAFIHRADVNFFCIKNNADIIACFSLIQKKLQPLESKQVAACEFGSFAVHPHYQAQGLGKQLLSWGEAFASDLNCTTMQMQVLAPREDLIAYYQRRGYQLTPSRAPFPKQLAVGTPLQDALSLVLMEKTLPAS
ncbi:GNAT family N-acetyltransferase [Thalassolituus sp. C2-1]|uniref:GNAT family N-acetyltransferase n=1 Tax=Venatorbacter sp. C2-1 TaxID=2597518 RepID=UPI0011952B31|nr:GNAT family N-acetyltransferase [Thalassolituus sp. C2-1]TVV42343.1 GNAT family N-acetyltransferase [Thalassolituus sp. C2-1]